MPDQNDNSDPELISEVHDGIGWITLNRPKALNALSLGMIKDMRMALGLWATDATLRAVVVRGIGGKAFCAGGDIRALYDARKSGPVPTDFFREEYLLDSEIYHFPKPYIALIDGITMGGGVGISAPAKYRIASDRTLWAMPETAIGMFPDVGGSYYLSRMPGAVGPYLGLTGHRLKAADALAAGVATHFVPADLLPPFLRALPGHTDKIDLLLSSFASNPGTSELTAARPMIDDIFSLNSLEAIVLALQAQKTEWSQACLETLARMSPTSLKLSLEAQKRAAGRSFDEVMKMEFRIVSRVLQKPDFFEGVRALLIDKDQAPKWSPSSLRDVTDAEIAAYFEPLPHGNLPL